jgi:hypothetical protein
LSSLCFFFFILFKAIFFSYADLLNLIILPTFFLTLKIHLLIQPHSLELGTSAGTSTLASRSVSTGASPLLEGVILAFE